MNATSIRPLAAAAASSAPSLIRSSKAQNKPAGGSGQICRDADSFVRPSLRQPRIPVGGRAIRRRQVHEENPVRQFLDNAHLSVPGTDTTAVRRRAERLICCCRRQIHWPFPARASAPLISGLDEATDQIGSTRASRRQDQRRHRDNRAVQPPRRGPGHRISCRLYREHAGQQVDNAAAEISATSGAYTPECL